MNTPGKHSPEPFLTIDEARDFLEENFQIKLTINAMYYACRDSKLTHYKPFGKILFRKSDLNSFVEQSKKPKL